MAARASRFGEATSGGAASNAEDGRWWHHRSVGEGAIAGPTTDGARTITIHGDGATLFPAGRYHIRPLKDAAGQIIEPVCGSLLTTSTVPVGEDFDYVFDLISDCNLNGVVDADDIFADPTLHIYPMHEVNGQIVLGNDKIDTCEDCVAYTDVSLDGNSDQGDVDTIINWLAGNCEP